MDGLSTDYSVDSLSNCLLLSKKNLLKDLKQVGRFLLAYFTLRATHLKCRIALLIKSAIH